MTAPEMDEKVPADHSNTVIDLRARRGTSRYTRQSGALPRLADDPNYVPMSGGLPHPVAESTSFFAKLRDRLNGRAT
jgi:hypothetical protein